MFTSTSKFSKCKTRKMIQTRSRPLLEIGTTLNLMQTLTLTLGVDEHFHSRLEYVTQLLHTWHSTLNVLMSKYVLPCDDHEPDNLTVLVANDNQESSNNNNFLNISRTVS